MAGEAGGGVSGGIAYLPSPITEPYAAVDVERYRRRGPHIGHQLHLCELATQGQTTLEEFKLMVKDAKFICRTCGRAAAEELHLCDPVPLGSATPEGNKH
jgi:hypothetical protein